MFLNCCHFLEVFSYCCDLCKLYKLCLYLENFCAGYIPESISVTSWLLHKSWVYSAPLVSQILHLTMKLFLRVNYNGLRVLQISWMLFALTLLENTNYIVWSDCFHFLASRVNQYFGPTWYHLLKILSESGSLVIEIEGLKSCTKPSTFQRFCIKFRKWFFIK